MRVLSKDAWNYYRTKAPKQVNVEATDQDQVILIDNMIFLIQKPSNNVVAYAIVHDMHNIESMKEFLRLMAGTNQILRIEEFKHGHYNYLERTFPKPVILTDYEINSVDGKPKKVYYLNCKLYEEKNIK
jgi:hypothetical protein